MEDYNTFDIKQGGCFLVEIRSNGITQVNSSLWFKAGSMYDSILNNTKIY